MTDPTVAYFSAEYAIADDMPIYAGGLGVLAADMVLEASSQNRDFQAVGLVYHLAFTGDDPDQRPMTARLSGNGFEVARDETGQPHLVEVEVDGRRVSMQAWVKSWGKTRLILLDTNLHHNSPEDRAICDRLYAADPMLQFAQEMCLGFGGVRMLELLGSHPDVYHINEGHTVMAGLAVVLQALRAHEGWDLARAVQETRGRLVGTKHTILAGAGLVLPWSAVDHQLGPTLRYFGTDVEALKQFASKKSSGEYSGTHLMIQLTRLANGVSRIHVTEELQHHPHSQLIQVTNGVFSGRWAAENWGDAPLALSDVDFWSRHSENRRILFDFVSEQTGQSLDPDKLTVVWARRMAGYKRPELLVSDLKKLIALATHPEHPVQFLVAGRANPSDTVGVELMNRVIATSQNPKLKGHFAYLPRYNPVTARLLVRGADVWLNTPIRGYEACGTSGMKASLNGAVQFSTSDGWLDEVKISPIGWRIPVEHAAHELYERLEEDIAPMFYKRGADGLPHEWIDLMRANMMLIIREFTATRMLDEYYFKMYAPDGHV